MQPAQHAITLEQVVNLLINYTVFLAKQGNPSTWAGSIFNPIDTSLTALDTAFSAMITGAALPTPPVAAGPVGGGNLTTLALTQAAIEAALIIPILFGPEIPLLPILEPYSPGIGRPATFI